MKNKVLAALLCISLLFALFASFSMTTAADEHHSLYTVDGYTYGLSEGVTVGTFRSWFDREVTVQNASGKVLADTALVPNGARVFTPDKNRLCTMVLEGDVSRNGKIDSNDALRIRKIFLSDVANPDTEMLLAADINENGQIDSNDYLRIRYYLLGGKISLARTAPAGAPDPTVTENLQEETSDMRHLISGFQYTAQGTRLFEFSATDTEYNTVQGACIVNDSFRIAVTKKLADNSEMVRLLTVSKDGTLLNQSNSYPLDHANNLSYNEKRNAILVSHCQAPSGHNAMYSLLDADTYEVIENKTLVAPFFAMAYSAERDMYASGQWSGQTLDTWDKDFTRIKEEYVTTPGSLSQGVCCDGDYIYFVRSSTEKSGAEIRIYNWDLELVRCVPLSLKNSIEPESINIASDGTVYVIGNDWSRNCGVCFSLTFTLVR